MNKIKSSSAQRNETRRHRMRCAAFIDRISAHLLLPNHVACTAKYYVQFFYIRRSFHEFEFHEVASGALLLAIKVCEFLKMFQMPVYIAALASVALGGKKVSPDSKQAKNWHAIAIYFETAIASAIGFELWITLPHDVLYEMKDCINMTEKQLSTAYEICNECMNGEIITMVSVESIAAAAVYFSLLMDDIEPNQQPLIDEKPWWKHYQFKQGHLRFIGIHAMKARKSLEQVNNKILVNQKSSLTPYSQ